MTSVVFQAGLPSTWRGDVVLLPLFAGEEVRASGSEIPEALGWLAAAAGLGDFRGKKGEMLLVHGPVSAAFPRVLLLGMGKMDTPATRDERLERVREVMGKATAWCREHGLCGTLSVFAGALVHAVAPGCENDRRTARLAVREAVCGALLGLYRNRAWKSEKKNDDAPDADPERLLVLTPTYVPEMKRAVEEGGTHAEAVIAARNLANAPANRLTPADMAEAAQQLAEKNGLSCEVLELEELERLGMGAFVAVGAGSAGNPDCPNSRHAPRLIVLEYAPAGQESEAPVLVVGKGITFDSGGISLKPSAGMWEMKGDMGGAAAVLGLFEALGRLRPERRVVGLLACAENMPGAYATRPGDIVTTLSGKTVEIVNTDAEGRLVLCDALTYAQQRWSPRLLVDVATLTGACVVALGDDVAGLFCEEPELAARIRYLGGQVGEPFWPLPLHERYFENLRSETADFTNAGKREGGACSAAAFLQQFVNPDDMPPTRWAHLDIAGPGFYTAKRPNCPAGASGFATRTLIELVMD